MGANPNIHHPRTRMPITHLTVQQAGDVADWLLSQEVKPEELADWKDPELPNLESLVDAGPRSTSAKAPGMTSDKVEEILKLDEILPEALTAKCPAITEDDLAHDRADADERLLARPEVTAGQVEVVHRPQEPSTASAASAATTCRASRRPSRSARP